ncbi:MAG: cupin domain-containing protein, partial [Candidatus Methylomirabilaceae bacterium]
MTDPKLPETLVEQAALYAIGALGADECSAFEAGLQSGPPQLQAEVRAFQAVADALALGVTPVQPQASLRERLIARIEEEARRSFEQQSETERRPEMPAGITFAPASEGEWVEVAPGITLKILFSSPQHTRTSALVRMAPGSGYGPHRHVEAEELYVLEGSCVCSGQLLRIGDYRRAEVGTIDSEDTYTADG